MSGPVLDASVLVSSLAPAERSHARAVALLSSVPEDEPFLVPAVFVLEVVAALARRGGSSTALDAAHAYASGPMFHQLRVDGSLLAAAVEVARAARLRAYDALYVAVSL